MDLLKHGKEKFPTAAAVLNSASLGWDGIAAEVRSHPAGELVPFTSTQTEITLSLRGRRGGFVDRTSNGERQRTAVGNGTLWITPGGSREEATRITEPLKDVAHIYLSNELIAGLDAGGAMAGGVQAIGYIADVRDHLIRQIGLALVAELRAPTPGGKVLAESLGLALAARVLQRHSSGSQAARGRPYPGVGIDDIRVERVIDYMMAHIEEPLHLDDLAAVACLSPFHFARTFRTKAGLPPHKFLSNLRLDHAKTLLARSDRSISDIALACQFASQSNFARAFKESTGTTPSEFRQVS